MKRILLKFKFLVLASVLAMGSSMDASAQFPLPYCAFTIVYDVEPITLVNFAGINNATSNTINGSPVLEDYLGITGTVVPGMSYPITLKGNTGGTWTNNFRVYIDWNQNNDFTDAGESFDIGTIYNSTGLDAIQATGNILVPMGAVSGQTRMRVTKKFNSYAPSCNTDGFGQAEDYTINVNGAPCTSPPVAGTTISSNTAPCAGNSFTLSLSGASYGSGQTYQWQSSPDNITWSDIGGANGISYSTSTLVTMYYRNIFTCSAVNDTSVPVQINVGACINMSNGSTVTCGGTFYDSGGPGGTYQNYENYVHTITPNPGQYLQVTFNSFALETCCDYLRIYDGNSTSAPLIGQFATNPGTITSSAVDGSLTFEFYSDVSQTPSGWDANLSCVPQPQNDAGLSQLISPSNPSTSGCAVNDSLIVELTSVGFLTLTSATINVSVNNGPVSTFPWTGTIMQGQVLSHFVTVLNLNDGDNVKVWVSNPNGTSDDATANDTILIDVYDAMNGSYTVGGASPDFATISDANLALQERGICSDIVFNIRGGIYNEQIDILPVAVAGGGTGNHTVTFQSEDLNPDSVKMEFAPGFANNYIIRFNGADNIIINAMTLSSTSTYSRVAEFLGGADNNTIRNSVLIGDTMANSDNFDKIVVVSTLDNDNNIRIINNQIWGGSRAISLGGISLLNPEGGATIDSNDFRDFYFVGAAVFNQNNATISNNTFRTDANNTNVFRIYANNVNNGIQVNGNRTFGRQGGFGINLDNASGVLGNEGLVSNNFVYMGDTSGTTTFSEGIYIQNGSSLVDVVANSIHVMNDNATSSAITLGAGTGGASSIRLYNNNVVNSSLGRALTVISNYNLLASNHNNFYTTNTNVVNYLNVNYATIPAFTAVSTTDANSVSVDPLFAGDDLHTCKIELDNTGMPYASVTHDFDNDLRTSTPDIGADEFVTTLNFSLGPDTIKCPNDSILLGSEGLTSATYYWSPYFQSTPSIYALNPGLYVVQVTSSCGAAVDTIVVSNSAVPVASYTSAINFYTVLFTNTSTNAVSYLWDFGDGNTSTDPNPNHVYADNGTYTVTLTAYNECGDAVVTTTTVTINVQYAGLDAETFENVNVFPNPSEGYFNVTFTHNGNEDIRLTVTDLSGRTVSIQNFGNPAGAFAAPVDIRGMAAGTYFLRIESGAYASVKKLIVK